MTVTPFKAHRMLRSRPVNARLLPVVTFADVR
jgi:hypothetical protein